MVRIKAARPVLEEDEAILQCVGRIGKATEKDS
jgi:hypothetical protein